MNNRKPFYCVLKKICYAFINSEQELLPVKKRLVKITNRYFYYLLFNHLNNYLYARKNGSQLGKLEKYNIKMHLGSFMLTQMINIYFITTLLEI